MFFSPIRKRKQKPGKERKKTTKDRKTNKLTNKPKHKKNKKKTINLQFQPMGKMYLTSHRTGQPCYLQFLNQSDSKAITFWVDENQYSYVMGYQQKVANE